MVQGDGLIAREDSFNWGAQICAPSSHQVIVGKRHVPEFHFFFPPEGGVFPILPAAEDGWRADVHTLPPGGGRGVEGAPNGATALASPHPLPS